MTSNDDWAIVVGINKYPNWPDGGLQGAVKDALAFREWLIDPAFGAVPESHITTLLSPWPGQVGIPDDLLYQIPTAKEIWSAIQKLEAMVGAGGRRLYVYFAGHGMSDTHGFVNDEAILTADFGPSWPNDSITTKSLFGYLRSLPFPDQLFFIDACRDAPWANEKPEFGTLPYPPKSNPKRTEPQQFRMYATSPLQRAAEIGAPGSESGAFSTHLLLALKGTGNAKRWNPGLKQYLVRVSSAFGYVWASLKAKDLQIPEMDGPRGGGDDLDPILHSLSPSEVPDEDLEIIVDPADSPGPATLVVSFDEKAPNKEIWNGTSPVRFRLQPREYSITTESHVHEQDPDPVAVALYQPMNETVHWRSRPPSAPPAPPAPPPTSSDKPGDVGTITVRSKDPLAPLELYDSSGRIVASGHGELVATGLAPGFYRAVIQTPEGQAADHLVYIEAGANRQVELDALQPTAGALMRLVLAGRFKGDDASIELSKSFGTAATTGQSIMLRLVQKVVSASGIGNLFSYSYSVPSRVPLTEGVIELLMPEDRLSAKEGAGSVTNVSLSPIGSLPIGPTRLRPVKSATGFAEWRAQAPAGSYWISIQLGGEPPVNFSTSVFLSCVTRLVLEVDDFGHAQLFQFVSGLGEPGPLTVGKHELLQRYALRGQLDRAMALSTELVKEDWVEPIAWSLIGYITRRLGRPDLTELVARRVANIWPQLSDPWILLAEPLTDSDPDAARNLYEQALESGQPVFADGLLLLRDGAMQLGIYSDRMGLLNTVLEHQISGVLWTAWAPTLPAAMSAIAKTPLPMAPLKIPDDKPRPSVGQ